MYMYERDSTLNNLEWLICHNTQPTYYYNQTAEYIEHFLSIAHDY